MCYTVSYSIFGKAGEICLSFPREETVFMKFIPLCSGADVLNEFYTVGTELIKVLYKATAATGHIQGIVFSS